MRWEGEVRRPNDFTISLAIRFFPEGEVSCLESRCDFWTDYLKSLRFMDDAIMFDIRMAIAGVRARFPYAVDYEDVIEQAASMVDRQLDARPDAECAA